MFVLHDPPTAASVAILAQSVSQPAGLSPGLAAVARFVGGVIGALIAAGLTLLVAPEFARRRVDDLRADPAVGLVWGLVAGVAVPVVLVLIAATGVGLVVAVPLFLVVFVHAVAGSGVAVLWVGSFLVDGDTGRRVAAGTVSLAVLAAIPLLGGLLTTLVSTCGLGVVARATCESRW